MSEFKARDKVKVKSSNLIGKVIGTLDFKGKKLIGLLVLLLIILLVGCSKKDEIKHNTTYNFHKEAIAYINNAYNFEATDKYLRDVFVESYIKTKVVENGVNFEVYIVLNIKNALTTDKRTFHLKGYNDSQGNHFTEIKEVGGVSVLQTFNFKYTNKIDKEWKQNND